MGNGLTPLNIQQNNSEDNKRKQQLIIGGIIIFLLIIGGLSIYVFTQKNFPASTGIVLNNENIVNNKNINYGKKSSETKPFNNYIALDTDEDGLNDYEEKIYGTMYDNADSDGDGYSDLTEIHDGYNPLGEGILTSEMKVAIENFNVDTDGDELTDIEEKYYKTSINKPDTDGDGYSDYMEIIEGLDPLSKSNSLDPSYIDKMLEKKEVVGINENYDPEDYNAKKYFNIDINESFCITEREREFERLFNKYRATKGLPPISLSRSLSYVAKVHSHDLIVNTPDVGACSGHSWSDKGDWSACCYENPDNSSQSDANCMHNKPSELTDYKWYGGENGMAKPLWVIPFRTQNILGPGDKLQSWINSPGHHAPIVHNPPWQDTTWNAFGISIYRHNANLWFGEHKDVAEAPIYCSENDFAFCDKLTNGYLKDECWLEKSIAHKDLNICEKIIDNGFREDCYLAAARAIYNVDYYICENNFENIGVIKIDLEYLEKKRACVAEVNSHPGVCDAMPDCKRKDECYYNAAKELKEDSVCRKINDWEIKDDCYIRVAARKDDISICDKIIYSGYREVCYGNPELIIGSDYECDNLTSLNTKDGCYLNQAKNIKEARVCEKITDGEIKIKCYNKACGEMLPSQRPDACSPDSEEKRAAIDWCYKIASGKARDYCFIAAAEDYGDYKLCDKIEDSATKDKCYSDYAKNQKDIGLCNYVSDSTTKNECIDYINLRI